MTPVTPDGMRERVVTLDHGSWITKESKDRAMKARYAALWQEFGLELAAIPDERKWCLKFSDYDAMVAAARVLRDAMKIDE